MFTYSCFEDIEARDHFAGLGGDFVLDFVSLTMTALGAK